MHNGCVKASSSNVLRLIALFKLLKAAVLIAIGVGALKLLHKDVAAVIEHWVEMVGLDPSSHAIDVVLQKASNISPDKLKELGIGTIIYAGLFLTEGIGLWLRKRWAEWLTVIITASLIPIEIYEIWRQPTAARIVVLLINLAIVGYLLYRIRAQRSNPK